MRTLTALTGAVLVGLAAAGCVGSSKHSASTSAGTTAPTTTTSAPSTTTDQSPGALQAEAQSAATGDIPDNQAFVVLATPRYAMKYPEGWAVKGGGKRVVIRDKDNIVRVVEQPGSLPAKTAVSAAIGALPNTRVEAPPSTISLPAGPAIKVVYSTESAPNPVTGKRVRLVVDRYYVAHGGKEAIVDLGTPQGVDNVDAYRLMIESLRWT
jgi:hypothetical protein